MSSERDSELLSAYLDGEVDSAELNRVNMLLKTPYWQEELERLQRSKSITAMAPRLSAPEDLVEDLKRRFGRPPQKKTVFELFSLTRRSWTAAGSLAAAALLLSVWINQRDHSAESIPLEPLLAAHSRYRAESALHLGPVMAARYSTYAEGVGHVATN